jgi:DNA-binding MarR family transcriptional regulator
MIDDRKKDLLDIQEMFTTITRKGGNEWNQNNPTGLSITHALILKILNEKGPQRPSHLADELHITTGGVTGLTDKLVKEELIKRTVDEQDRRVTFLEITDAGRDRLKIAFEHRHELTERLFGMLSDSDIEELKRMFSVILQHL